MKRRFRCPVQAQKEYVAEVLAGGYRIEVVARRYDMSPKTLREWVRQHPQRQTPVSTGRPIPGYSMDKKGHRVPDGFK